jgi:hypothetical protein
MNFRGPKGWLFGVKKEIGERDGMVQSLMGLECGG